MAVKLTNNSAKVIGIGNITVLPGETKDVPDDFERSPILEVYKNLGLITLTGKPKTAQKSEEEIKAEAEKKAKLDSLKDASDEDVAALAQELGINPAECKDQADVRKKVKATLSK